MVTLLVGALALAFGQGHWPNGVAVIIGVFCVVRFFRQVRPAFAAPLFVVAHVAVWELAYAGMVPLPTPARIGMEVGTSSLLACVFLMDRWISLRVRSLVGTLALPCGWVAYDVMSARFSPGGTWGSIAYSYADTIVIAQVASFVGWTGLTFLAAWLASTANFVLERRRDDPDRARVGLVAMALATAVVVAAGVARLSTVPVSTPVRVACVVPPDIFNDDALDALWAYTRGVERPQESVDLARRRIKESLEEHFALVDRAADSGAQLVVWPEANPVITEEEEAMWIDRAQATARSKDVYIGMGMVVYRPESGAPALNKFVLVSPTGEVVIDFLKATHVPGTRFERGDGALPAIDTDLGRISSAICFDLDFPHLIAQAGAADVDLMLAPSNDWVEACRTHARMARLRAIEQGFALIRPTKDGVSLVTDSSGRTAASLVLPDDQSGSVVVEIASSGRPTLYSRIGDAFAWLCVTVLLTLIGRAVYVSRVTKAVGSAESDDAGAT